MKKRSVIIGSIILPLLAFAVFKNIQAPENITPKETLNEISTTTPLTSITYTNATSDMIIVELPFVEAVTGKEFTVIGKARGTWFFEASFPIEVLDENNKVLTTSVAQAQGEWMTTEFVPFTAQVKVNEDFIGKARLVLKKDNPSGMTENDASISFPITIEY